MTDRTSEVTLRYKVDQSALSEVQRGVEKLLSQLKTLASANDAVGSSAEKAANKIRSSFSGTDAEAIRKLRDSMGELADEGERVQKSTKFDVGLSGVRRTGSALNQLGLESVGRPVQLVGDAAQVGKELSQVGAALTAVGVSATAVIAVVLPVVAAIAAFTIGVKLAGEAAAEGKRGLDAALDSQKEYFQAEATLTTQQAQKRLDALKRQGDAELRATQETQRAIDSAVRQFNLGGLTKQEQEAIPGVVGEEFRKLYGQLEAGQKDLDNTTAAVGRFEGGLKSGAFAANDMTAAEEGLAKKREKYTSDLLAAADKLQHDLAVKGLKALDDQRSFELQLEDLKRNGREKDLDAEMRKRDNEINANQREINSLSLLKDSTGQYADKIQQLKERNTQLVQQQEILIGEAQAYTDANEKRAQQEERDTRVIAVRQKYEDQVTADTQKALQARAELQKRYNDALISAAEKATNAAEDSLRKLEQQREDLSTGKDRDLLKSDREQADKEFNIRLTAQREEAKSFREHLRTMQQIRDDAQDRERDLILANDFIGLLQSRRQTTHDLTREGTTFSASQSERQIAERNNLDDERRAEANQRRERLIAYDQARADAQTAYNRELQTLQIAKGREIAAAEAAHRRDLQSLNSKIRTEENLRDRGYAEDLKRASLYGAKFVEINDKTRQAVLSRAEADLRRFESLSVNTSARQGISTPYGGTRTLARRAGGGPLAAGQFSLVNDPGSESFNGVPFPPGLGVFMPLQGGNVTRSITATQQNNISGISPERLLPLIDGRFENLMEQYLSD